MENLLFGIFYDAKELYNLIQIYLIKASIFKEVI